ncbi:hypothetical protein RJT34_03085 [Clitoria ternatea]|uniref:MACPF domain-containing protein n=1 Tax=Clitoria ternatea TaxID=43366 RepID=A0AAN9KL24_CLITE
MALATRDLRLERAQQAIDTIGLGFDVTKGICFDNCKRSQQRLIQINEEEQCRDLKIPDGVIIPNVPNVIKCLPGESIRIPSELLNLSEMSEQFNTAMRLVGRIPSGHFCDSFGVSSMYDHGRRTECLLAYDGWFITRYTFELDGRVVTPCDHVKQAIQAMPSACDTEAMARFIERYGTHVVVGVSMGGKDVLYARQEGDPPTSSLLKLLGNEANSRFMDSAKRYSPACDSICYDQEVNVVMIHKRRGGRSEIMSHNEWLDTVDLEPDVISLFLLPLSTLLAGSVGAGFLSHAINLYQRYRPPIEDLHKFLELQLPRQWAPSLSDAPLGSRWRIKHQAMSQLPLSIFGPVLYINTTPVDVGKRPVTGLRLVLEGTRSNRLAIQLQHLTSLPKSFPLSDKENAYFTPCASNNNHCNFNKKLKWNSFSRVCTAPVESDDSDDIVSGAQLLVDNNCLRLRLRFSRVVGGATLQKPPEWDESRDPPLPYLIFTVAHASKNQPKPGDVTIGSAVHPVGPPPTVKPRKLERFIDRSEIVRGAMHSPGYWVVSGAALSLHNAGIKLRVKYSLLNFVNGATHAVDVL